MTTDREREEIYRRFSPAGLRRQRRRRLLRGASWVALVQTLAAGKRIVDVLLSLALLVALSPLIGALALLAAMRGRVIERTAHLGRWCRPYDEYAFALPRGAAGRVLRALRLHRLPVLWNVLRGDMAFVGPRAARPGELSPRQHEVRKRYNVRPGLICLWWIRCRANIAYDSEVQSDAEYVETRSVLGDFGILLRAVPAMLYGEGVATARDHLTLLDIPVNNLTMDEALDELLQRTEATRPSLVCFVNAHCANIAARDADYLAVLQSADLSLADGIGLKLAGKLLGNDIRQNVNGTDLFPRLCARLADTGKGLYLLGAKPGVAQDVADWVAREYPGVTISGVADGYFTPEQEPEVVRRIAASGAAVLLTALGVPRQEKWLRQHFTALNVPVAMGVGGLFDFYAGRIPRAPQWLREAGLEWFYRFWQEPGRMWRRYLVGNAVFLVRVLRWRMRG